MPAYGFALKIRRTLPTKLAPKVFCILRSVLLASAAPAQEFSGLTSVADTARQDHDAVRRH
jgi:hypothetical protein